MRTAAVMLASLLMNATAAVAWGEDPGAAGLFAAKCGICHGGGADVSGHHGHRSMGGGSVPLAQRSDISAGLVHVVVRAGGRFGCRR